jgi:hypothetical protein
MGRLVVILLRSGAPRLDAVFSSVHGFLQKLAIYCHYRGTGYNFLPIVFASALHCLSDSVGTEFSNKKTVFSALTTVTKPDKLARLGMFPCFSRRAEGRGRSEDFPQNSSFTFPFLSSLYAQHAWASEIVRCLGGSYFRDLTNFFGHYFLALCQPALGLDLGWDWKKRWYCFFNPRWGVIFWSAASCVRTSQLLLPFLDCLFFIQ